MQRTTLEQKLQKIRLLADECLVELGFPSQQTGSVKTDGKIFTANITVQIVNKVVDCDESDAIRNYVLDKKGVDARILMCFYVSYKYFENTWLTSGDIEKITSELGAKVDLRNASNYLKNLRAYLESGTARKKGQSTLYRLNRRGVGKFEEVIHVKET